jgi:hypothetical protein
MGFGMNSFLLNIQSSFKVRASKSVAIALMLISVSGCQNAVSETTQNTPAAQKPAPMIFVPGTTAIQEAIQAMTPPAAQNSPQNPTVYLKGIVGDRVPLLGGNVYELQDSTGKVWVLTKTQPPEKGQELTLKGVLRYKSIPLNGKEQGAVYLEQQ